MLKSALPSVEQQAHRRRGQLVTIPRFQAQAPMLLVAQIAEEQGLAELAGLL